jgi:hypothetical protein
MVEAASELSYSVPGIGMAANIGSETALGK